MGHRHCEINGCYDIATTEVGAMRDTHHHFGSWEKRMWVCKDHLAAGIAACGKSILAGLSKFQS